MINTVAFVYIQHNIAKVIRNQMQKTKKYTHVTTILDWMNNLFSRKTMKVNFTVMLFDIAAL